MTTTLTPILELAAKQVGRRVFRKQILRTGTIDYKGQKITFDRQFLADLAESFNRGAYDQVPLVFADPENRHNMDPRRFGGEVKALELTPDGLDAVIEASEDGAEVISKNPRLGVSARIVQGLSKSDGRSFRRAIQHVLLTMDPRITGLRPWQTVDLSGYDNDVDVVDLTTADYQEDRDMGTDTGEQVDLSALSDDQFLEMLDLTVDEAEADEDDLTEDEVDALDQVEDEGDEDEDEDEDEGDEDEDEDEDTDLSHPDLADNALEADEFDEVTRMRMDLAQQRWDEERRSLIRDGVPPALLDLAAPLLSTPDAVTIDLSNADDPVNATEIVRGLLTQVRGMIDLTPEIGHQVDLSEDKQDADEALLAQWDQEYGQG